MTTGPVPVYAPGVRIRDMTADDCEAVAAIRVRGWQSAYRGIVPQPYLDAMDVAEETERRRGRLARGGGVTNLVALAPDSAVTGWACYGPRRDGQPGDAELYAIYVLPGRTGTGVGRALMAEGTARAGAAGHLSHQSAAMVLWVLTENAPARRFYERAGFRPDGATNSFDILGTPVPEVRYARALPAASAPGAAVRRPAAD
ncbi:MAG TPA: GNAT family N-acetyltransferase [Streptomyces sp.]